MSPFITRDDNKVYMIMPEVEYTELKTKLERLKQLELKELTLKSRLDNLEILENQHEKSCINCLKEADLRYNGLKSSLLILFEKTKKIPKYEFS